MGIEREYLSFYVIFKTFQNSEGNDHDGQSYRNTRDGYANHNGRKRPLTGFAYSFGYKIIDVQRLLFTLKSTQIYMFHLGKVEDLVKFGITSTVCRAKFALQSPLGHLFCIRLYRFAQI